MPTEDDGNLGNRVPAPRDAVPVRPARSKSRRRAGADAAAGPAQDIRRRWTAERAAEVVGLCGLDRPSSPLRSTDARMVVQRVHCFENVTAIVFLASLSGYDVRTAAFARTRRPRGPD